MVIEQGGIYWADLGEPHGSEPGFVRPVLVVQCDELNRSRIGTVVCIPLTSNVKWADAPGNVLLPAGSTGLPKDSVANTSQIVALDRTVLVSRVGEVSHTVLLSILAGIDVILGRGRPVTAEREGTVSSECGSRRRRFTRRKRVSR